VFYFVVRFVGWGIQWSIATAFFILVMAGAGYYVFNFALSTGAPVTVPDILDLPINEASLVVAERGLEIGKQVRIPHPNIPKDRVISQRPEPGRVVRQGRKVYPTVSMGNDVITAPSLVKIPLDTARRQIAESRFRLGSVARIPSDLPRDIVIAQDPPAGRGIPNQGSISLLVSGGDQRGQAYMPDIRGMNVQDVLRILAPLGLKPNPREVDLPGAKTDTVLNQEPAPDTPVYPGQVVSYEVKMATTVPAAPVAATKETVRHVMPSDWYASTVRVDVIDKDGKRQTVWRKEPDSSEQARTTYVAGSAIRIPVAYAGQATVEVYVDGQLSKSYLVRDPNAGVAPAN